MWVGVCVYMCILISRSCKNWIKVHSLGDVSAVPPYKGQFPCVTWSTFFYHLHCLRPLWFQVISCLVSLEICFIQIFLSLARSPLAPEKGSVLCWRESGGQHFHSWYLQWCRRRYCRRSQLALSKTGALASEPWTSQLDIWSPAWLQKEWPAGLLT